MNDALPSTLAESLCYLNGQFGPVGEAKVSVMDRGFLFGDGIYEVIPVYGRRLFCFDAHMARLERGLAKVGLANPMSRGEWLALCRQLIAAQVFDEQRVYIQVTRGVAPRDHAFPKGIAPTVYVMCTRAVPVSSELRHQGAYCITARDFRWERGDIKSVSLLGNVLARQMSIEQGAVETILFRDGFLTEGSSSNVWVVHEGALLGPPKSEHVLEGVRYELLRELCEDLGIAFNLRPIAEADVFSADEVLLSSASKEVLAVTRLDGEAVGHGALRGKPGPVYARLYEAYQNAKQSQVI